MQCNQAASLARSAGTSFSLLTVSRHRRGSGRSVESRYGVRRPCRCDVLKTLARCRSHEVSDTLQTTTCWLSLGVSDRSEMRAARSCTVATSGPEECGHSVVSLMTTAVNVGNVGSRNHSTSSALCWFDNFHHDLSNLSVNCRKISGQLFSAFNTLCSFKLQCRSVFNRILLIYRWQLSQMCYSRIGVGQLPRTTAGFNGHRLARWNTDVLEVC